MKLITWLRIVSLFLMAAGVPLWRFWSMWWTVYVMKKYGFITDSENAVQISEADATAFFVFFAPVILYTAYQLRRIFAEVSQL